MISNWPLDTIGSVASSWAASLNQGNHNRSHKLLVKLKSSIRKFHGRHHAMVNLYGISVSHMTTDMLHLS